MYQCTIRLLPIKERTQSFLCSFTVGNIPEYLLSLMGFCCQLKPKAEADDTCKGMRIVWGSKIGEAS